MVETTQEEVVQRGCLFIVRGSSFTRMIECRYWYTLATIQVFNCFPRVFGASRLEIVQVISLASLDHVHNFIPEVVVFAQTFMQYFQSVWPYDNMYYAYELH